MALCTKEPQRDVRVPAGYADSPAPSSKIANDSLDLPIAVAHRVKPTAPGMLDWTVRGLAINFGTTRFGLG